MFTSYFSYDESTYVLIGFFIIVFVDVKVELRTIECCSSSFTFSIGYSLNNVDFSMLLEIALLTYHFGVRCSLTAGRLFNSSKGTLVRFLSLKSICPMFFVTLGLLNFISTSNFETASREITGVGKFQILNLFFHVNGFFNITLNIISSWI